MKIYAKTIFMTKTKLLQYHHKRIFEKGLIQFYLEQIKNGHFKNVRFSKS